MDYFSNVSFVEVRDTDSSSMTSFLLLAPLLLPLLSKIMLLIVFGIVFITVFWIVFAIVLKVVPEKVVVLSMLLLGACW